MRFPPASRNHVPCFWTLSPLVLTPCTISQWHPVREITSRNPSPIGPSMSCYLSLHPHTSLTRPHKFLPSQPYFLSAVFRMHQRVSCPIPLGCPQYLVDSLWCTMNTPRWVMTGRGSQWTSSCRHRGLRRGSWLADHTTIVDCTRITPGTNPCHLVSGSHQWYMPCSTSPAPFKDFHVHPQFPYSSRVRLAL